MGPGAPDEAHGDLSGPAVRRICQREYEVFGNQEFQRLAGVSVSHIYNLRHSAGYRKVRVPMEHTRSRPNSIGERRKPGLYHINVVDTVTQARRAGARERT